jgi:ketopantoate reductase
MGNVDLLYFPSMYQDLINNNRRTEIDYINGAVARLGSEHHIVDLLYHLNR